MTHVIVIRIPANSITVFAKVLVGLGIILLATQFLFCLPLGNGASVWSHIVVYSKSFDSSRTAPLPVRVVSCNDTGCWNHTEFDYASVRPNCTPERNAKDRESLPQCSESQSLVGNLDASFSDLSEDSLQLKFCDLEQGGSWRPRSCKTKEKLAVIIPFRDRQAHLRGFLNHMHPILQRQELDYRIFVVEQVGNATFNKGILLNAGFLESQKLTYFDCYVFHDVDLLLENDKNLYRCGPDPRHLSVGVDKFNYTLPYKQLIGGVSALTPAQYWKVNGYSNSYWGWGGEDDDLAKRVELRDFVIQRPDPKVARYRMVKHQRDAKSPENPISLQLLKKTYRRFKHDGLNSVPYTVVDIREKYLYTLFQVDCGVKPDDNILIDKP